MVYQYKTCLQTYFWLLLEDIMSEAMIQGFNHSVLSDYARKAIVSLVQYLQRWSDLCFSFISFWFWHGVFLSTWA